MLQNIPACSLFLLLSLPADIKSITMNWNCALIKSCVVKIFMMTVATHFSHEVHVPVCVPSLFCFQKPQRGISPDGKGGHGKGTDLSSCLMI